MSRGRSVPIGLALEDASDHVGDRLSLEGRMTAQAFEEQAAERPDVGAAIHDLPARLLGAHVGCGPEDDSLGRAGEGHGGRGGQIRGRAALRRAPFREPEIEDLHVPGAAQHDVARLEIAVHDSARVGGLDGRRDLPADPQRLASRERSTGQALRERFSLDELEHEVGCPRHVLETVDTGDVGMVQ